MVKRSGCKDCRDGVVTIRHLRIFLAWVVSIGVAVGIVWIGKLFEGASNESLVTLGIVGGVLSLVCAAVVAPDVEE